VLEDCHRCNIDWSTVKGSSIVVANRNHNRAIISAAAAADKCNTHVCVCSDA